MRLSRSKSSRNCWPVDEPAIESESEIKVSSFTIQQEPAWRLRRSFTSNSHKPLRKSIMAMVISGVAQSILLRTPSTVIAAATPSVFTTRSTREARLCNAAPNNASAALNAGRMASFLPGLARSFLFVSLNASSAPAKDLLAPRFLKNARTLSPPMMNFIFSGTAALRVFQYNKIGAAVKIICVGQLAQNVGMRMPAKNPAAKPPIKMPCHLNEGNPHWRTSATSLETNALANSVVTKIKKGLIGSIRNSLETF